LKKTMSESDLDIHPKANTMLNGGQFDEIPVNTAFSAVDNGLAMPGRAAVKTLRARGESVEGGM
jgi:hypothetical protein